MPFALISHIYYMQSFLSCVKVYSMVLLNIHLRDGFILLSKKQKKNEQCWNMAYDCIFSHLLARILLFWWDWEWQIYTALLLLINLRKAWQEDLKSTRVAHLSLGFSKHVWKFCSKIYLFTLYRVGKSLNLRTGSLSVYELGLYEWPHRIFFGIEFEFQCFSSFKTPVSCMLKVLEVV